MTENNSKKREKTSDSSCTVFIIFTLCFFTSIVLGFAVAGEQIFDPELYSDRLDMMGEWRFKNEDTSIFTVSIIHFLSWIKLVHVNAKISNNILITIVVSIPMFLFFLTSWLWIVWLILVIPSL